MDPAHARGATSEFYAAAWWSSRGYELFWPVGSGASIVDFIAVKGGQKKRVQVKTGSIWTKSHAKYLSVSIINRGRRCKRRAFDYLSVVSPYGWMLNIPTSALPTRQQFHIRLSDDHHPRQENWLRWMTTLSH